MSSGRGTCQPRGSEGGQGQAGLSGLKETPQGREMAPEGGRQLSTGGGPQEGPGFPDLGHQHPEVGHHQSLDRQRAGREGQPQQIPVRGKARNQVKKGIPSGKMSRKRVFLGPKISLVK